MDDPFSDPATFKAALDKARADEKWDDVGGLLREASVMYVGFVEDEQAALIEAAECHQRTGNRAEQAWCLHDLGYWYVGATRGDEAIEWLEKSLALFEELGDIPGAEDGISSTRDELAKLRGEKPFSEPTPPTPVIYTVRDASRNMPDPYAGKRGRIAVGMILSIVAIPGLMYSLVLREEFPQFGFTGICIGLIVSGSVLGIGLKILNDAYAGTPSDETGEYYSRR